MINPQWDAIFKSRDWQIQPAVGVVLLFALGFYHSPRKDIKIIDLGCGTGANLWYLAAEGYQVYGLDGSPTALEKSKENLDRLAPNWVGELKLGDFTDIPYPDNYFDVAIDINAITCNPFDEMKAAYKEAHRVLKPNGLLHSQIFAEGMEAFCLPPGTGAEFVSKERLPELYGDFGSMIAEHRQRPFFHHQDAVREWMVTVRKRDVAA